MKHMLALFLALVMAVSALPVLAEDASAPADAYNWYEIFVRSYQDSDGDGIGDLQGVISRLDYIKDMGWQGLWLMPIMPSPSYHKYDVTDYQDIDPEYGDLEDMRQLVSECHARGIRIIIDLPVNHTSTRHPWFLDAVESIQKRTYDSPYINYYCFSDHYIAGKYVKISGSDWHYEEQFAGGSMPDLNLDCPEVKAELRGIVTFWLDDVGVDGFRLDAVTSFYAGDVDANVSFLNELKDMCEAVKPGSYLVGEAWVNQSAIAEYAVSRVDSFFLFSAAQMDSFVVKSLLGRSPNGNTYASGVQSAIDAMPDNTVLAPFLCNHDTGRTIGLLQARKLPERAKFAHGLLGMVPGNVFTYYGDEIGMVGAGDDPNKRLAMFWNDGDMTRQPPGVTSLEYAYPCVDDQLADEGSLLNYIRQLNHVRLAVPAIARGENAILSSSKEAVVMSRTLNGETIYIAANFAKGDTVVTLSEGLSILHDLEVADGAAQLNGAELTMPSMAIVVLK